MIGALRAILRYVVGALALIGLGDRVLTDLLPGWPVHVVTGLAAVAIAGLGVYAIQATWRHRRSAGPGPEEGQLVLVVEQVPQAAARD